MSILFILDKALMPNDYIFDKKAIIADGMIFPCGKVAMCWRKDINSVVIHDNIENFKKIHINDNRLLLLSKIDNNGV